MNKLFLALVFSLCVIVGKAQTCDTTAYIWDVWVSDGCFEKQFVAVTEPFFHVENKSWTFTDDYGYVITVHPKWTFIFRERREVIVIHGE